MKGLASQPNDHYAEEKGINFFFTQSFYTQFA